MPQGGFVTQLSKELFCLLETIYTLTQFVHKNESQTAVHKNITAKTLLSEKKKKKYTVEHCLYGPHWAKKIWVVFFFNKKMHGRFARQPEWP